MNRHAKPSLAKILKNKRGFETQNDRLSKSRSIDELKNSTGIRSPKIKRLRNLLNKKHVRPTSKLRSNNISNYNKKLFARSSHNNSAVSFHCFEKWMIFYSRVSRFKPLNGLFWALNGVKWTAKLIEIALNCLIQLERRI